MKKKKKRKNREKKTINYKAMKSIHLSSIISLMIGKKKKLRGGVFKGNKDRKKLSSFCKHEMWTYR